MQNALNRLRDLWQNTSRANQTLLIAIAGIASLVGVGFLYWASSPDYQSLVTTAAAMAGLYAGALAVKASADEGKPAPAGEKAKEGCGGKDGCKAAKEGKDTCKSADGKDTCKAKDGCKGKDGCGGKDKDKHEEKK